MSQEHSVHTIENCESCQVRKEAALRRPLYVICLAGWEWFARSSCIYAPVVTGERRLSMSYLALYRKYRPKDFDEIVDQKAVVTTLRNQVKFNQLGHAYLFCGTRGTGKTSAAKVFAKAVNCLNPIDGNPCNCCELCMEAEQGFNTIEIDAASNNGVDNIRDLREEVQYTPTKGRFKVYIIDEVHMLSTSAFNALLKTLEEPPEHVIFVLATTDPQKVIPTIISRCQRYDFKRITAQSLKEHLRHVCDMEGIQAEDEALSYIAMMADGGCRDALSILDQCHAYYINDVITLARAQEVLGAVDESIFREMTISLTEDNVAGLLSGIEKIFDDGRDPMQFIVSWSSYLRDMMVAVVLGDQAGNTLHKEDEAVQVLRDLAERATLGRIANWVEELAKLEAQMRGALQRRILMEIGMIRLVNGASHSSTMIRSSSPAPSINGSQSMSQFASGELKKMERRIERLEKNVREGTLVSRENPVNAPSEADPAPVEIQRPAPVVITDEETKLVISRWNSIVKNVTDQQPGMMTLQKIRAEQADEPGVLRLVSDQEIYLKTLTTPGGNKIRIIENAIADETGKRFKVIVGKAQSVRTNVSQEALNKINMDVQYTDE